MKLRLDLVKQLLPKRKETKGVSRSAPPGGETVYRLGAKLFTAEGRNCASDSLA